MTQIEVGCFYCALQLLGSVGMTFVVLECLGYS